MKILSRSLLIFSLCSASFSSAVHAADWDKQRRITVQGQGKVSMPPDQARLWVEITEEGARIEAVTQTVRQKMDAILKTLKSQGVAEKDIQTQVYRIQPKIEWRNGRSIRNGFTGSNQVEVTVKDLKKTGALLSAALDAGANNVNGPQFEFSDPQDLERKALESALKDAKAKAALLAGAAGASLGEVLEIQEVGGHQPPPQPMYPKQMRMSAMADVSAPEPIVAGEETIQASVSVVFALK